MIHQFLYAALSIIGFSVLFNIPSNAILKTAFSGALGWFTYAYMHIQLNQSLVIASFVAACMVAFISEIFARRFKEAVTVFIIPGILPLVPGSGMYYTMLAIIEKDFSKAALIGSETFFVAGSIAAAIFIIASITRLFFIKKI
ncbi:MAG: threonine/serine exporter family protein [Thermotaleaceae bacterium]